MKENFNCRTAGFLISSAIILLGIVMKIRQHPQRESKNVEEFYFQYYRNKLIGCFRNITSLFEYTIAIDSKGFVSCYIDCANRNFSHSALLRDADCFCCNGINKTGDFTHMHCKSNDVYKLYFVRRNVEISDRDIDNVIEGRSRCCCKWTNHQYFPEDILLIQENTQEKAECFLHCGKKNFLWSILLLNGQCICSNKIDRLNLKTTKSSECNVQSSNFLQRDRERVSTGVCSVYRTFVRDESCLMKSYSSTKSPSIGIISFPGSGNTWIRHLIELGTGIYTGSTYDDEELFSHGFFGELLDWKSGKTLGTKEHALYLRSYAEVSEMFEKSIILIRNPFDSLLAEYNRMVSGHVGHRDGTDFQTSEWTKFVIDKSQQWTDMHLSLLSTNTSKLVVTYENLTFNLTHVMKAILQFMNVPNNVSQKLTCIQNESEGFFRRQKIQECRKTYTYEMSKHVNKHIGIVRAQLLTKGFKSLPPYEKYVSHGTTTEHYNTVKAKQKAQGKIELRKIGL